MSNAVIVPYGGLKIIMPRTFRAPPPSPPSPPPAGAAAGGAAAGVAGAVTRASGGGPDGAPAPPYRAISFPCTANGFGCALTRRPATPPTYAMSDTSFDG